MKIFVFLLLIYASMSRAQDSSRQAIAYTQRAILAYPYVKTQTRKLEKRLISYIPVEREYIIATGTIGVAIVRGRVETRPIKKLDIPLWGGQARPDIFWDFRGKDSGMYFNITWGF